MARTQGGMCWLSARSGYVTRPGGAPMVRSAALKLVEQASGRECAVAAAGLLWDRLGGGGGGPRPVEGGKGAGRQSAAPTPSRARWAGVLLLPAAPPTARTPTC